MNTYVAGFIILVLVFSISVIAGSSQTAGFTFNQQTTKSEPKETQTDSQISFGGSQPKGKPEANYDRFNPKPESNNFFTTIQRQTITRNSQGRITETKTPTRPVGPLPNTFISEGPDRTKDFILDEATFKFSGFLTGSNETLRFETRLIGAKSSLENWRSTSKKDVTYKLDIKGTNFLIFEVRAKTKDGRVDFTPASWALKVVHSQFWGDVKISSVRPGLGQTSRERFSIRNSSRNPINITGWQVADLTSRAIIGQGVEIVQPRSNLNFLSDIILQPRGSADIFTQASLLGFSWQENSCNRFLNTGFIDGNKDYETCYFQERLEDNFLKDDWNIYLSLITTLWDENSTFFILDRSGAVVDVKEL